MAKLTLHGCYVATLTPFDTEDRLDLGVIEAHTQYLIANGVAGLCPAGTTGEFLYLGWEEQALATAAVIRAADGKVPVLAGVWSLRSEGAKRLAQAAEGAGADGVFLPPPIYYPASDDQIFQWYAAVKEATTLPVFAYNIPQYAANEISSACLERLFAEGIIAGAKDSSGKAARIGEMVQKFGADNVIFAASDSFATEGRKLGADGFISALANVVPDLFVKLWNGDESLQPQVDALRSGLKQVGSIPALKYLLHRRSLAFGNARMPFSTLTTEQKVLLDALELPSE